MKVNIDSEYKCHTTNHWDNDEFPPLVMNAESRREDFEEAI